jgi:hypothetical protein
MAAAGCKDDEDKKSNADTLSSGSLDALNNGKDVPAPTAPHNKGRSVFAPLLLGAVLMVAVAYSSALYVFRFPVPSDYVQARTQLGELSIIISERLQPLQPAAASAPAHAPMAPSPAENSESDKKSAAPAEHLQVDKAKKLGEEISDQFTHEELFLEMDSDGSGGLDENEVK